MFKKNGVKQKPYAIQMVRVEGLEPTRREALDPKSSMSTNFITPAFQYNKNSTQLIGEGKSTKFSNK